VQGDKLFSFDKNMEAAATVLCVVQTKCVDNKAKFVQFEGGLQITSWHPVRIDGKWVFPNDASEDVVYKSCDRVYNFLLDTHHVAVINDVECICLAHGIIGDVVASHEYYGSQRVVSDLMILPGWSEGNVTVDVSQVKRNGATNLVVGLKF
jgi:hypothetical protein